MYRIAAVRALPGRRLWVRFDDGLEGEYAVEPARRGGMFDALLDPAVFNAVFIDTDFGCVEWPGGVDLCPNAMHAEVLASRGAT